MRRYLILTLVLLLSQPQPVWGHDLEIFAYVEGQRIIGSVYFSSGAVPTGADVIVREAEGEVTGRLEVDAQGRFSHIVEGSGQYQVVARTGDGHQAKWTIDSSELAGGTDASGESAQGQSAAERGTITMEREAVRRLIESAVARQVGPLRAELRVHAHRARLADIIGGLGGIVGIAGLGLWWRARRLRGVS